MELYRAEDLTQIDGNQLGSVREAFQNTPAPAVLVDAQEFVERVSNTMLQNEKMRDELTFFKQMLYTLICREGGRVTITEHERNVAKTNGLTFLLTHADNGPEDLLIEAE